MDPATPALGPPRTAPVGSCPLCASTVSRLHFRSPDRRYSTPGEFSYRRCLSCRTVYQDPRIISEDLALAYPNSYYTHGFPTSAGGDPSASRVPRVSVGDSGPASESCAHVRRDPVIGEASPRSRSRPGGYASRLRDLLRNAVISGVREAAERDGAGRPPHARIAARIDRALARSRALRERAFFGLLDEMIPRKAGGRALEVGCGAGGLLIRLARAGWRAEGVEWDASAAVIAERVSGCRVGVGHYRELDLPDEAFDLVVLHHVLEHLDDVHGLFLWLRRVLSRTGTAVLAYPNPEGLNARLFGSLWYQWDSPRHLVLPPADALARSAEAAGLRVIRLRTTARTFAQRSAESRAYRRRQPPHGAKAGLTDRAIGLVAAGLSEVGVPIGEEIVAVLARLASDAPRAVRSGVSGSRG